LDVKKLIRDLAARQDSDEVVIPILADAIEQEGWIGRLEASEVVAYAAWYPIRDAHLARHALREVLLRLKIILLKHVNPEAAMNRAMANTFKYAQRTAFAHHHCKHPYCRRGVSP